MAIISNLDDVLVIRMIADCDVTVADGSAIFPAVLGDVFSVAPNQTEMVVSVAGDYPVMLRSGRRTMDNVAIQAFCPESSREAV